MVTGELYQTNVSEMVLELFFPFLTAFELSLGYNGKYDHAKHV